VPAIDDATLSVYGVSAALNASRSPDGDFQYTIVFSEESDVATIPSYMTAMDNSLMQGFVGTTVAITSLPLPPNEYQSILERVNLESYVSILVTIGFGLFAGFFAFEIVKERHETKLWYMQSSSGATLLSFWLANGSFDSIMYVVSCVVNGLFALFLARFEDGDTGEQMDSAVAFLVLLLVSMPATLLQSYVFALCSESAYGAQAKIVLFHFVALFAGLNAIISPAIALGPEFISVRICVWIGTIVSPIFGVVLGFLKLLNYIGFRSQLESIPASSSAFEMLILGEILVALAISAVLHMGLLFLLESWTLWKAQLAPVPPVSKMPQLSTDTDVDVLAEKERLRQGSDDCIQTHEVTKVFQTKTNGNRTKVAVDSLSLGVPAGQIFGLLGHNGAGKTTSMKMMATEFLPDHGTLSMNGHSASTERSEVKKSIGLCPQHDVLFEDLTPKEHLRLYASLKGVGAFNSSDVEAIVDGFIALIDLHRFEDAAAGSLSGGNKRKLSLAIALMGNPSCLLLDEPSTGMDPQARRFMWNLIKTVTSGQGKAVVLTTHSMEECQALCSRIGIMNQGKLACLGTPQRLKSRFGEGYRLEIKTGEDSTELDQAIVKEFGNSSKVLESHNGRRVFWVPVNSGTKGPLTFTLSHVFATVLRLKNDLGILDYSISQPTLEQIFLQKGKHSEGLEEQGEPIATEAIAPGYDEYAFCIFYMLLSAFPLFGGLHHAWLGNKCRCASYFVTLNFLYFGLLYDLLTLPELLVDAKRRHGKLDFNTFRLWGCCCSCCCKIEDGELEALDDGSGSASGTRVLWSHEIER
jgi:ABC-type multidrug transport system ATPase subunit